MYLWISPVEQNKELEKQIVNDSDLDIEETEELDFEDAPEFSMQDRHRYLLDEFEDFPDDNDDF